MQPSLICSIFSFSEYLLVFTVLIFYCGSTSTALGANHNQYNKYLTMRQAANRPLYIVAVPLAFNFLL